jgi:hypothetical protein
MIISHSRKFIFIKPMKVAGTSLEIALSKYCYPSDILTPFGKTDEAKRRALGYTPGQNNLVTWGQMTPKDWARWILRRPRRRLYYSHDPAATIRKILPRNVWDSYLKIAAVRNPYDYAVSRYYWEQKRADATLPAFDVWLVGSPEILLENRTITHIDRVCAADVMLRYEHFDEDLSALSKRLDLPGNLAEDMAGISTKASVRPKDNSGPGQMFRDHPYCKELVRSHCAEDIVTYDYHVPD